jgi:hypothetical protein
VGDNIVPVLDKIEHMKSAAAGRRVYPLDEAADDLRPVIQSALDGKPATAFTVRNILWVGLLSGIFMLSLFAAPLWMTALVGTIITLFFSSLPRLMYLMYQEAVRNLLDACGFVNARLENGLEEAQFLIHPKEIAKIEDAKRAYKKLPQGWSGKEERDKKDKAKLQYENALQGAVRDALLLAYPDAKQPRAAGLLDSLRRELQRDIHRKINQIIENIRPREVSGGSGGPPPLPDLGGAPDDEDDASALARSEVRKQDILKLWKEISKQVADLGFTPEQRKALREKFDKFEKEGDSDDFVHLIVDQLYNMIDASHKLGLSDKEDFELTGTRIAARQMKARLREALDSTEFMQKMKAEAGTFRRHQQQKQARDESSYAGGIREFSYDSIRQAHLDTFNGFQGLAPEASHEEREKAIELMVQGFEARVDKAGRYNMVPLVQIEGNVIPDLKRLKKLGFEPKSNTYEGWQEAYQAWREELKKVIRKGVRIDLYDPDNISTVFMLQLPKVSFARFRIKEWKRFAELISKPGAGAFADTAQDYDKTKGHPFSKSGIVFTSTTSEPTFFEHEYMHVLDPTDTTLGEKPEKVALYELMKELRAMNVQVQKGDISYGKMIADMEDTGPGNYFWQYAMRVGILKDQYQNKSEELEAQRNYRIFRQQMLAKWKAAIQMLQWLNRALPRAIVASMLMFEFVDIDDFLARMDQTQAGAQSKMKDFDQLQVDAGMETREEIDAQYEANTAKILDAEDMAKAVNEVFDPIVKESRDGVKWRVYQLLDRLIKKSKTRLSEEKRLELFRILAQKYLKEKQISLLRENHDMASSYMLVTLFENSEDPLVHRFNMTELGPISEEAFREGRIPSGQQVIDATEALVGDLRIAPNESARNKVLKGNDLRHEMALHPDLGNYGRYAVEISGPLTVEQQLALASPARPYEIVYTVRGGRYFLTLGALKNEGESYGSAGLERMLHTHPPGSSVIPSGKDPLISSVYHYDGVRQAIGDGRWIHIVVRMGNDTWLTRYRLVTDLQSDAEYLRRMELAQQGMLSADPEEKMLSGTLDEISKKSQNYVAGKKPIYAVARETDGTVLLIDSMPVTNSSWINQLDEFFMTEIEAGNAAFGSKESIGGSIDVTETLPDGPFIAGDGAPRSEVRIEAAFKIADRHDLDLRARAEDFTANGGTFEIVNTEIKDPDGNRAFGFFDETRKRIVVSLPRVQSFARATGATEDEVLAVVLRHELFHYDSQHLRSELKTWANEETAHELEEIAAFRHTAETMQILNPEAFGSFIARLNEVTEILTRHPELLSTGLKMGHVWAMNTMMNRMAYRIGVVGSEAGRQFSELGETDFEILDLKQVRSFILRSREQTIDAHTVLVVHQSQGKPFFDKLEKLLRKMNFKGSLHLVYDSNAKEALAAAQVVGSIGWPNALDFARSQNREGGIDLKTLMASAIGSLIEAFRAERKAEVSA